MDVNYCLSCSCYDSDMGCTMPSLDRSYACPYGEYYDDDSFFYGELDKELDNNYYLYVDYIID